MMKETPLVSVIVPVYNVRDYLEECVRSIVAQTYRDIEVILVDDGSADGSGELCDELASGDSRVTVYHKENGGLSDARNFGIARCHGEWVAFVDSDDWVSPVFVEALLRAALDSGCDISAIPTGRQFRDGEGCDLVEALADVPPARALGSAEAQRLMLYQRMDTAVQWRLYRREVLGADPFPKGLYYEDLASVYRIVHGVESVAVVDCRDLYAYRLRRDGIIRQDYRHIKAVSALKISEQLNREICAWYPEFADAAASRCFSVCRMVFAQIPTGTGATEVTRRDRDALWKALTRHRITVLCDPRARKRERFAASVACFGRGPFGMFCKMARKMRLLR